ncbi:MAG: HAMP domain-containing protein, partial [SAR324 cluster bacterium]|nr:HAMP domain-containing protein [SAR324 cluster bacterium]
MIRYRFRDKLLLSFAVLLAVTFVPVLVLVNTQIDTISEAKIEQDLHRTRKVFQRFQRSQLVTLSERASTFVVTQPEIRAEIVNFAEELDDPFADIFGDGSGGGDDPFAEDPIDADDPFSEETAAPEIEGGGAEALPERQNRILSVLQELTIYNASEVFFLTDYQGRLVFNKDAPGMVGDDISGLPAVYGALEGNEIFTWWGSRDPALAGAGLMPDAGGAGVLYQMFLKPVIFAGEVKGVVGIGSAITGEMLGEITGITQAEVVFLSQELLYIGTHDERIASTLAAVAALPELAPSDTGADEADGVGQSSGGLRRLTEADEEFLALPVPVESTLGEPVGQVLVYRSKTQEKRVYENMKTVLNAIGIAALVLAAALGSFISFSVSRALKALSEGVGEVRGGNLDYVVTVRSRDEFGTLSDAFNEMTAGLKEKEAIRNTFKRYVSSSVVDELLKDTDAIALGGENKTLTIQFSDIAGFTSLSETLTPEGVVEFLNEYLSEMTAAVEAEQGIVDKYIGDAVMAFWGAPLPLEDHPLHACRAALAQGAKIAELRRAWAGRGGLSRFHARIGLHTGEVIVGNIGSSTRMDYTIIGDAVNTASRLEGLNKLYGTGILISEETCRGAGAGMVTREIDLVRAKGKAEVVRIYELLGERNSLGAEALAKLDSQRGRFAEGLRLYRSGAFGAAR